MKKIYISIISLALVLTMGITANAQNSSQKWGLGFGFAGRDFQSLPKFDLNDVDMVQGFNMQLNRYLNSSLDLGLSTSFTPTAIAQRKPWANLWNTDLLLKLKVANGNHNGRTAAFVPIVQAGPALVITGEKDNKSSNFFFPAGLGLRIQTGTPLSLNFDALYNISLSNTLEDFVGLRAGVNFALGRFAEILPPPPPPLDTDGDGIVDAEDACPTESGLAQFQGCPDKDGDGVADKDDDCPEVAGLVTLKGCPEVTKDADGDGIADDVDDCPNVAGIATFNGCPDTDGDGIMDKNDDCPTVAGLKDFKGCPDTDGDGIMDKNDDCPKIAGSVDMKGCPDTDGDGIRDIDDRCPDVAGVAAMQGCPEIEKEVIEQLARITKAVRFHSGSDVLTEKSRNILNEIVSIMNEHPQYSLVISGHTDSQGREDNNLALSSKRALSCLNFIAAGGVDASRMQSSGYGEAKPIESNINAAGRAANRRVEFELVVK